MTPENNLSRLAVASAMPSIMPSARGPAINTDDRYSGNSGYNISEAESLTKLIRPISHTVPGSARSVCQLEIMGGFTTSEFLQRVHGRKSGECQSHRAEHMNGDHRKRPAETAVGRRRGYFGGECRKGSESAEKAGDDEQPPLRRQCRMRIEKCQRDADQITADQI